MERMRSDIIGNHANKLVALFLAASLVFTGFIAVQRLRVSNPVPLAQAASVDYLLEIDGVAGTIEVDSFSWGVSTSRDSASGQATGKRQYQPIIIKKTYDKSSPLLFRAAADGTHIKSVTLTSPPTSGAPAYKVVFQDVMVSSFQQQGDAGSPPSENVSFTYQKISF